MAWQPILRKFLLSDFPSLFDEATIEKNAEIFDLIWQSDKNYSANNPVPITDFDFPHDAIDMEGNAWVPALPFKYVFYDLDNDGVPEAFIGYAIYSTDWTWTHVYKLYGDSYKQIGVIGNSFTWETDKFYVTAQNETVMAISSDGLLHSVYFVSIQDEKLIYSDYIDPKGNIYNSDITSAQSVFIDPDTHEFKGTADEFTLLPEFDCSDVIDSLF